MHKLEEKLAVVGCALFSLALVASCGGNKKKLTPDAGLDAGPGGQGGQGGRAGTGGKGGTGGQSAMDAAVPPMMMITCTEDASTGPITCGGQSCAAPATFAMNQCVVPCCLTKNGQETCGSKSTAMGLSTDCVLPASPDPNCPDLAGMAAPFKGCCNEMQHTCGFISTFRPGCITQSMLVMLPNPPLTCSGAGEDGGTGDAGQ